MPGGAEQVKLLVRPETYFAQAAAEFDDELFVVLIGDEREGRELEILPLFADLFNLTVNILLGLLSLLMELDQLAVADGTVTRIETRATANDIKNCVDTIGGSVGEAIFVFNVPAGYCLASDLGVAGCLDSEWWLVHLVQGHDACGVVHEVAGNGDRIRALERKMWSSRVESVN